MPSTYEPIATNTLSSPTTSFTFSSIPQTYTHLRLIVSAIANSSAINGVVYVNSDTAANYARTTYGTNGQNLFGQRAQTTNFIQFTIFNAIDSANMAYRALDFFDYTSTLIAKPVLTQEFSPVNTAGSGSILKGAQVWNSTSAITSLNINTASGNSFGVGSVFTLFGILAA
jgi:hypothetical protein